MLINKVSDDACYWNGHDVVIAIGGIFFIERFYVAWRRKLKLSIQWPCSLTTEGVSAVLLSFLCLWNVPGVGAFDHLNGPQCGAFERHFGPGRGEFERQFTKKSNARGVSRGGGMLKLRFDWYIMITWKQRSDSSYDSVACVSLMIWWKLDFRSRKQKRKN